jgi:hypothetical protein
MLLSKNLTEILTYSEVYNKIANMIKSKICIYNYFIPLTKFPSLEKIFQIDVSSNTLSNGVFLWVYDTGHLNYAYFGIST